MDKFQEMYRIESSRLKNWDYGTDAYYFVTICTQNREHFFGKIRDSKMALNEIGKIAKTEWLKTLVLRPDMNLKLGEFVIMPNHFHAIIYIGKNIYNSVRKDNAQVISEINKDAMHRVSAKEQNRTISTEKYKSNKFGPQSKNLSSIIRGFKSSVTVESRKINQEFSWQSRFHDHVIRDKKEWYAISNYIKNNPKNWNEDELYI